MNGILVLPWRISSTVVDRHTAENWLSEMNLHIWQFCCSHSGGALDKKSAGRFADPEMCWVHCDIIITNYTRTLFVGSTLLFVTINKVQGSNCKDLILQHCTGM